MVPLMPISTWYGAGPHRGLTASASGTWVRCGGGLLQSAERGTMADAMFTHMWKRAVAVVAAAGLAGAGAVAAGIPGPAVASTTGSITLTGHGWGHGRGMGQWGALGYALQGWSAADILAHYYGGTTAGTVANNPIRVRMTANDGSDVILTSPSAFTVAGVSFAANSAALMHLTAPGQWSVQQASSCAGPWTQVATAYDNGTSTPQAVAVPSSVDPNAPASALLALCEATGNEVVRGDIAAAEVSGQERTVNVLPLESYLRGVVPAESPGYWGTLGTTGPDGNPQGLQALETQAVAARSYAVADEASGGVYGYADVCDSAYCQVYRGVAGEYPTSDQAVALTAGQVRLMGNGSVALTEFSSSTGGWTAGGTFPAVADDGDAVCTQSACNPNHTWTTTISLDSLAAAFPSVGTVTSVTTTHSGPAQADFGGRVASVQIVGGSGSTSVSGDTFAADFGLKSNWFEVTSQPTTTSTTSSTTTSSTTTSSTTTSSTTTTSTTTTTAAPKVAASRIAGPDRIATAIDTSMATFGPGQAGAAVLARDDTFPDALAGTFLAADKHGPVLLTDPTQLDSRVSAELQRILPAGSTVYILGGSGAMAPAVASAVEALGYHVTTLAGSDRFGTAVAVAQALGPVTSVLLTTGDDFPDALSAAAAYAPGRAILLTDGTTMPSATASYMASINPARVWAVGGPAAGADSSATALVGADRYATAVTVARTFAPTPTLVGLAVGTAFPDALAAGARLAAMGSPLLLTQPDSLPSVTASYLAGAGSQLTEIEVYGGTAAVSTTVMQAAATQAR